MLRMFIKQMQGKVLHTRKTNKGKISQADNWKNVIFFSFVSGRCCLSHTVSKEQPLESKVCSSPGEASESKSSHSPSPGGSKTLIKELCLTCFWLFPVPWVPSPSLGSVPQSTHYTGWHQGSREETSAQLVARTWQGFPHENWETCRVR